MNGFCMCLEKPILKKIWFLNLPLVTSLSEYFICVDVRLGNMYSILNRLDTVN